MGDDQGQRVVEVLEAHGPSLPIAVLARRLEMPPTRLVALLDDLYDAGRVTPGLERGTVTLVPQPRDDGRFRRSAAPDVTRTAN